MEMLRPRVFKNNTEEQSWKTYTTGYQNLF